MKAISLKGVIPLYPGYSGITLPHRAVLDPIFRGLRGGVSEFTFANIYLFREAHSYRLSVLEDQTLVIAGRDHSGGPYFMLPFGLPENASLTGGLFRDFQFMKNASEDESAYLSSLGYRAEEDRDNFDYLYSSEELKGLAGRKFHSKKNLINSFLSSYVCEAKPLVPGATGDGLRVLETWRRESGVEGDFRAAREALERSEELCLCGGVYYIDGRPVAYALGEELREDIFVVHFEKGVEGYRGLLQFVNHSFVSLLPDRYTLINREQDLGDEGLRRAKMGWRPVGFVKKYRVYPG